MIRKHIHAHLASVVGSATFAAMLLLTIFTCAIFLLGACKKSPSSNSQSASSANVLPAISAAKIEDLPTCSAGNANQMAYVAGQSGFYVCKDDKWVLANVKVSNSVTETIDMPADSKCPYGAKKYRIGYPADPTQPKTADSEILVCNPAPGDTSALGPVLTASLALYKKYRRSVYRLAVQCSGGAAWTASAFRCTATDVCTNFHALDRSQCGFGSISRVTLEAVKDADDTTESIFFNSTSPTIKSHPTKDVAKLAVNGFPANAEIIPMMAKDESVLETLSPILSLSFPLGFEELYTDVGNVNVNAIQTCPTPSSCPGAYDFGTNNNTDHGSSGSPLIEVSSGKVVGVTSAGTDNVNANFTWALFAWRLNEI